MKLYELDPTNDARWIDLIGRRRDSSVFHTPGWLESLRRTYGYEPVVFTDSAPGKKLNNGLLFCRISSWMTGRRLVSLPFSDHCEPLVESPDALVSMLDSLKILIKREGRRYIELRCVNPTSVPTGFTKSAVFSFHSLDLRPDLEQIFSGFHKSCVQRSIRRAHRVGLTYEVGRSASLLTDFHFLQTLTRRRHQLPAQPLTWFRNLLECLGQQVQIHLARHEGRPVAAILATVHNTTLTYKYGCSDARYHRYGGTPLLLWKAIQDAKEKGLTEFDLGRSDTDNEGLLAFKDHLGARRTPLNYYRYSRRLLDTGDIRWLRAIARSAYSLVPEPILAKAGSGLYKHLG